MFHNSVLLQEVIENLNVRDGGVYIDATLGGGGMSIAIIERLKKGVLICIDRDIDAIRNFSELIEKKYKIKVSGNMNFKIQKNGLDIFVYLYNDDFRNISECFESIKIEGKVLGIIYDFGVSSFQLDNPDRGFSYMNDSVLDMRMDRRLSVRAEDLLAGLYENELERIFRDYGDEPLSKLIAKEIVKFRKKEKVTKSSQLLGIIAGVVRNHTYLYHHASRIFQALRIAVNDELGAIHLSLPQLPMILDSGGRVEFLTFHSLEDREVKIFFKDRHDFRSIYDKPIRPTDIEIKNNIRSRSAKLRVYEKI